MHKAALITALVFACVATSAEARRHYWRSSELKAGDPRSSMAEAAAGRNSQERNNQETGVQTRQRQPARPQNQGTATVVPSNWKLDPPDPGWKGYRYRSPDGAATAMFYSTPIDQDPIALHWKGFAFRNDEEIMFLERGRGWVVASGITGDRTSYRKAALDCHERVWRHIELEFPTEAKSSFDSLIGRVAHTLDFALANNWASSVAAGDACEQK
jgi:hypothetical protein